MAITGNYLDSVAYTGARKWGTGINPVHSISAEISRVDTGVPTAQGPNKGDPNATVPAQLLNPQDEAPEYGYTDEEFSSMIWGYGPSTGTSDRTGPDVPTQQSRAYTTKGWPGVDPQMGTAPGGSGPPGGPVIRQESHGDFAGSVAKLGDKEETVGEGSVNKEAAAVVDAIDADPAQV